MTTHLSLRRLSSLLLVITALLLVTLTVTADSGQLKDIKPGTGNSFPRQFIQVNSVGLFRADDGVNGTELWKTNGTPEGTVLLKDIWAGNSSSLAYSLTPLNASQVIFTANDNSHNYEPWITDGTPEGTVLIKDICPGGCAGRSYNAPYSIMGGVAYFEGYDGLTKNGSGHGSELWRSDGTLDGTYLLKDIYSTVNDIDDSDINGFTQLGNQLFFVADDSVTGSNVWVTDGTTDGTHLVCDLSSDLLNSGPDHLVAVGNWLLFVFKTDGGDTWDLYRTQGGTSCEFVKTNIGSYLSDRAVVNGYAYFPYYDDTHQNCIWRTDGTTAGTTFFTDQGYPENFIAADNGFFFRDVIGPGNHNALFFSDGTPAGTQMVLDLHTQAPECDNFLGSPIYRLLAFNNRLFFIVREETYSPSTGCNDPTHFQIWSSDGTEVGTKMEMDIYPGIRINSPGEFGFFDGLLIIEGYTTTYGWEPWMLNPVPPPTSVPVSASNLSVQALSDTQVQLTWQDNSDNEQGFHIFRGDGVTWSDTPLATANKDATTFTDTTAGCGTRYYYRVMAYNVLGPSLMPTNTAVATTPVCVPAAPTNVAVKVASQVRATVSWKPGALGLCPVSGNWVGCSPVQGYLLERKPDGGDWAQIVRLPSRSLSFSDGSLVCNSAYSYRLRATNTSGESAYSSVVDVTSLACAAPPKPAWVRLTNLYARGYMLSWQNVEGETSYVVQRARNGGAWADWTTLDQDRTSLLIPRSTSRYVTYTYRVRAVNAYGESAHAQVGTSSGLR